MLTVLFAGFLFACASSAPAEDPKPATKVDDASTTSVVKEEVKEEVAKEKQMEETTSEPTEDEVSVGSTQ